MSHCVAGMPRSMTVAGMHARSHRADDLEPISAASLAEHLEHDENQKGAAEAAAQKQI
jgi:hypothetical protein